MMQPPAFNTTDPASVLRTNAPLSNTTTGLDALPQQQLSGGGGVTLTTVVELVLGALLVSLLVAGVTLHRRSSSKRHASVHAKLATADEGFVALDSARMDVRASRSRTRNSSSEFAERWTIGAVSPGAASTPYRTHRSSSMWDDAVIVAARIPFDKVVLGPLLNRGAFGEVYSGTYRAQAVAVKRLVPETRRELVHIERFLCEIKLQAALEHPHIVAFVGVAWESLSELYAVSEFMNRGDLRTFLVACKAGGTGVAADTNANGSSDHSGMPPYAPPQAQGFSADKVRIALHIAHALTYLHSLQPPVLHRDLKSRNILLDCQLTAKLTDFGVSRRADTLATLTAGVGSSRWMAPEVMLGKCYGAKSDVFSLGVVLSELDTHELPYAHAQAFGGGGDGRRALPEPALLQLVAAGQLEVQFSHACAPEMQALARQCLRVAPSERPSAAEVLYQLHVVLRKLEMTV